MWETDDEVRATLTAELNEPAPAPRTELVDVLHRGRRRVLVRRGGAVAGVLAVVCGVGFGASTVRGAPVSEPAVPPLPRVHQSAGPEWVAQDLPCVPKQGEHFRTEPADFHVVGRVIDAMREVARPADVQMGPYFSLGSPVEGGDRFYEQNIVLSDADGPADLPVLMGEFDGAPAAMADYEAHAAGGCQPPRRLVRPDGSVLQLYPVQYSEPYSSQVQFLRVYTAKGRRYEIQVRNFGHGSYAVGPTREFVRTGPGRETLPLDELQLTKVGLAVADGG